MSLYVYVYVYVRVCVMQTMQSQSVCCGAVGDSCVVLQRMSGGSLQGRGGAAEGVGGLSVTLDDESDFCSFRALLHLLSLHNHLVHKLSVSAFWRRENKAYIDPLFKK